MKVNFLKFSMFALALVGITLASCKDEGGSKVGTSEVAISNANLTTHNSITVDLTPNGATTSFQITITDDPSIRQAFIDGTTSGIEFINNGNATTKTFNNLKPETEYTVFAMGWNSNGDKGTVTSLVITTHVTPDIEYLQITENIVMDNAASIAFKPLERFKNFQYYLGSRDDADAFYAGEIISGVVTVSIISDVTSAWLTDLTPSTEYVMYAKVNTMDDTAEFYTLTFNTKAEGTVADVDFEVEFNNQVAQKVKITPDENCSRYVPFLSDEETWASFLATGDPVSALMAVAANDPSSWPSYTAESSSINGIDVSTETFGSLQFYPVLVYGLDGDVAGLRTFELATPSSPLTDPAPEIVGGAEAVTINKSNLKNFSYTFTCSDNTWLAFFEVLDQVAYEEFQKEANPYGYVLDVLIHQYIFPGDNRVITHTEDLSGQPSGTYYLVIALMNSNGSNTIGWSTPYVIEFTI